MSGLYIHIPFCRTKCLYCDFYSGGTRIADWPRYIASLVTELNLRKSEITGPLKTLYIGGGTPSQIPEEYFGKLIRDIGKIVCLDRLEEFTLEANPEDINLSKCDVWKESGVNRLSLGVQSMNDQELKRIGRRHGSDTVRIAVDLLKKFFDNISLDVMFGIPSQSMESYFNTLEEILKLEPRHISSYSLMLEPGTAMTHLVETGKIDLPAEEQWLDMFSMTSEILKSRGYSQYEISNFSLPGFESKHNYSYWEGTPYLGLGPGAHSYDGARIRRANPADLKGYIKKFNNSISDSPFYIEEILSDEELREETIMTRLRTCKGLNVNEFENKFGLGERETLMNKAAPFVREGLLNLKENALSLSGEGIPLSDHIISSLF